MSADTNNESELDKAIAQIHAHMASLTPDTKEYAAAADQLVKLQALKKERPSWRPSADTLITVAGNVAVVLLIVAYEQKHVLTSKAVGFFQKVVR